MRVRLIEVECEGAQALEMVRELAGWRRSQAEACATMARQAKAYPTLAAPREKVARPAKAGATKAEDDGLGQKGDLQRLALAALAEGPKTSRQVADWISAHGRNYTPVRAQALLSYLGKRKRVRHTGSHLGGKWERV